ncbi:nitroreductase family protein [Streptococcus caviae]|uniref:nitroreductase family protein n=1 Tax=Streptococcus sp. 'caviae' TaxID=1915004 RepID=UPI00095FF81C|nr:nitroreductase family protein [Streptococcus sp. 'caviae']OLN83777.1 hypothetical protein BMI76_03610 [Streptococcus sp. 'caviae']
MNTMEAITSRYACRKFTKTQLTDAETQALIQAANAAPAGMGDYSGLKLTVVQSQENLEAIEAAAAHGMPRMGDHPTYQAPTLMILSAKINEQVPMISHCNVSAAAENIMLAATDMGLASVFIMSVPAVIQDKQELLEKLNIRDGFKPLVIVAVGHAESQMTVEKEKRLAVEIL